MKEYIEADALAHMATVAPGRSSDELLAVLDLIFDYYEDNGDLDWDLGDDVDEADDVDAMVNFVASHIGGSHLEAEYTTDELRRIIEAELDYEMSLL